MTFVSFVSLGGSLVLLVWFLGVAFSEFLFGFTKCLAFGGWFIYDLYYLKYSGCMAVLSSAFKQYLSTLEKNITRTQVFPCNQELQVYLPRNLALSYPTSSLLNFLNALETTTVLVSCYYSKLF